MPITDLSTYIAGLNGGLRSAFNKANVTLEGAGIYHSLLYGAGYPAASATPAPGIGGAALTTYAGQFPFPAAVGGENIYLNSLTAAHTVNGGHFTLCDRLWHNSGIVVTTTTAQTVTSVAWPARDRNGAVDGEDVQVALEVSTATTQAGAVTTITLSYTNQSGTAGRTATMASFPASALVGTFIPFALQAGDTGVRSIQSITLGTTLTAGAIHLVAYRVLGLCGYQQMAPVARGPWDLGLPRCYDNTVPFGLIVNNANTAGVVFGDIGFVQN